MRDSHPGLFRAMLKMGGFGLLNGLGMVVWPSRMPAWLPPIAVGVVGIGASIGVIVASFSRPRSVDLAAPEFVEPVPSRLVVVGRVCLSVLSVLYFAMAVSLFLGWQPPGSSDAAVAVTQSLDRVLLYGLASGAAFDMLREPTSNPVSARARRTKG